MPKYVIERNVPGAHNLSPAELQGAAAKSNGVLRELGHDVQWLHSYVAQDKIYCVYWAKDPEIVKEHAKRSGFPADSVLKVQTVIDPSTGERA